jgi:hypothetical protein
MQQNPLQDLHKYIECFVSSMEGNMDQTQIGVYQTNFLRLQETLISLSNHTNEQLDEESLNELQEEKRNLEAQIRERNTTIRKMIDDIRNLLLVIKIT